MNRHADFRAAPPPAPAADASSTPRDETAEPVSDLPVSDLPPLMPPPVPTAPPLLGRRMWLVTFTDLVSLLLAFFILLFAMQEVPEDLWRSTVDSLTQSLDPRQASARLPTAERTVGRAPDEPASDLDYLAAILAETLAAEPALAGARLVRAPDALVVALPPGRADSEEGADNGFRAADAAMLVALGGVLRHIGNPVIAIARTVDPRRATTADAWSDAIALAENAALALRSGGYGRPIVAEGRVFGDARERRLEIALQSAEARR